MNELPPFSLPTDMPVPEGELISFPRQESIEEIESREKDNWFRFISKTTNAELYSFPASKDNNTGKAILILPGGGYFGVSIDREGFDFARMFNSHGYSAFVLKYRMPCPYENGKSDWQLPLKDSTRAMRLIRSRAAEYGIDPTKVGILGFSAGGHLAAMTSNIYNDVKEDKPELAGISARPDFTILAYPVITFKAEFTHEGTRDYLVGKNAPQDVIDYFSMENRVSADTPQTFIVQTMDDVVNTNNSLLYASACRNFAIPTEMHIYPEGGHGYGMPWPRTGRGIEKWTDRLLEWLEKR